MKLLTKELLATIPPLYANEEEADPLVVCKFFMPDGCWTWYVIEGSTREPDGCGWGENCDHRPLAEYDPDRDDVLFFGYVVGLCPELGYFSLSELSGIRGCSGCGSSAICTSSRVDCLRSRHAQSRPRHVLCPERR